MISTEGFLKTLDSIENLTTNTDCNDDYDFGKVLSSYRTDTSEKTHKIRYSDGQERTFSFDD